MFPEVSESSTFTLPFKNTPIYTMNWNTLPYLLSAFSLGLVALSALVLFFLFIVTALKANREHGILPASLPWVGKKTQLLSSLRANLRGAKQSTKLFTEGYYKVFDHFSYCFNSLRVNILTPSATVLSDGKNICCSNLVQRSPSHRASFHDPLAGPSTR